jgi:hypothetical protein
MKTSVRFLIAAALVGAAGDIGPALADGHRYLATDPVWKAECGSCHLPYPPELLPASSWRALMNGLDRHFGTDASLESATAARISAFLERNAGRDRSESGRPLLRITESRWFRHEHDELGGTVWKNPKIKSPANCAACHADAEAGDFDEHGARIPR